MAKDLDEGFFIGNIIKYAARYKITKNLDDLKKCADYAHLACGAALLRKEQATTEATHE